MQATTSLIVRRPDFRLEQGDPVPFQWQPRNPSFGVFGNVFTFLAPAFERYIFKATRKAMSRIADPAILAEAEAFCHQEAQHAKAHQSHVRALIKQYPGLSETLMETNAAYDRLLAAEDLEFHLAYVANLEATFPPLFKMVLDNRHGLFEGGDERVGTLLLWHFVEEVEHRSSALLIHHHITPDRWYRLRNMSKVFEHVGNVYRLILAGFEKHVPRADWKLPENAKLGDSRWRPEVLSRLPFFKHKSRGTAMLTHVPGRELRVMLWNLLLSQTPAHDPSRAEQSEWIEHWHAAYEAGEDIATYAGARL